MPERKSVRADAESYAGERARMQAAGRFLIGDRHATVRIKRACGRGCPAVSAALSTRWEKFVMRPDSVKKIAACRMHRMPQAVYPGSSAQKGTAPHELAKAAASIAVNVGRALFSRDDADPALGSARYRPFLALRGSRSLRGRARRLVAVTAIEVDVGDAHPASLIRAGAGVPFVGPGRITGVDVWIDIGLCIGRRHADDHRQNAQPSDQSALHQFTSLSTNKCHTFYW